jgi:hypothetical protein
MIFVQMKPSAPRNHLTISESLRASVYQFLLSIISFGFVSCLKCLQGFLLFFSASSTPTPLSFALNTQQTCWGLG